MEYCGRFKDVILLKDGVWWKEEMLFTRNSSLKISINPGGSCPGIKI